MRFRTVCEEAVANLRHRPPLAGAALAIAIAVVACATATWAHRALQLDGSEHAAGRDVIVVTATSDAGLSMPACEALSADAPVLAAGGPYVGAGPAVSTLDQSRIDVTVVSPGALRVWLGDAAPRMPVLGQDLASVLDTGSDGSLFVVDGVPTRVLAVLPRSVPLSALQSTVVVPTLSASALAECWISFEPGQRPAAAALAAAAFAGTPNSIGPFLADDGAFLSAHQFWVSYTSAQVWAVAAGVAASLLGVTLFFRRRDVSVYLVSGFTRKSIAAILTVEAIGPSIFFAPIATAWGLAMAVVLAGVPIESVALRVAIAYATATWVVFSVFALGLPAFVVRVNPFAVLKDT